MNNNSINKINGINKINNSIDKVNDSINIYRNIDENDINLALSIT